MVPGKEKSVRRPHGSDLEKPGGDLLELGLLALLVACGMSSDPSKSSEPVGAYFDGPFKPLEFQVFRMMESISGMVGSVNHMLTHVDTEKP